MSRRPPKNRAKTAQDVAKLPAPKPASVTDMTRNERARAIHTRGVLFGVYMNATLPGVLKGIPDHWEAGDLALDYIRDMQDRMAPRDPAEEMLVGQLLLAHARVLHLTAYANQQKDLRSIQTLHEYADRASNTYRRLMLALAEYRRPPRAGDSFTAIKQANIAGQQVVQNNEKSQAENPTNEQGCTPVGEAARRDKTDAPPPLPALPADTGRIEVPAGIRPVRETVEAVHRPPNGRGQGPIATECPPSR